MQTVKRFGCPIAVDEVFLAHTSGDLARMQRALPLQSNGVDRHFLLVSTVEALYSGRADTARQRRLIEVARVHLTELPSLLVELRRHDIEGLRARGDAASAARLADGWQPPVIPTFDRLCMVLCEQGDFDAAQQVWRDAIDLKYIDEGGLKKALALIEKRRKRMATGRAQ